MTWILRALGALVLLAVIAVAALLLVPSERLASFAADRITAATGRATTIDGPVRVTLWPQAGIAAEDITVAGPAWADGAPTLMADRVEIGLTPAALWSDAAPIRSLFIADAAITLIRDDSGAASWDTATGPSAPASDAALPPLPQITLASTDIVYEDRAQGIAHILRAVDATVTPDGPALDLAASALVSDEAVRLQARVADLPALMSGTLTTLTAELASGATTLTLDGRADLDPPSFDGRARARSTDGFAILAALGVDVPDRPQGLGARSIDISTAATLAPDGGLHLRDIAADLDGNAISGALDLDPSGDRPTITANLTAPSLNLTGLSRKGQGGETALVSETGWGQDPIDVAALFAADAQVTLTTGPVTLGDATLDAATVKIALEAGRAVIGLQPVRAYGGQITGDIVVNGRGGLSSRATLDLSGLDMEPFLGQFAGWDRLTGQADASLRLLGVGNTAQALMDSLSGSMTLSMGEGAIAGLDIPGMIRALDASHRGDGATTVFDSVRAAFTVQDGVANVDEARLTGDLVSATATGRVDIGAQTLDTRLTSRLATGGDGLTVPILIRGSWDDPTIRLDLEAIARQRLDRERVQIEARLREEAAAARARAETAAVAEAARIEERLRAEIAAELDIDPEQLEGLGQAEDQVRDRVRDGLVDLLINR